MLRILHCPLSGPDLIYISLWIIFCIIEFVVNKEPWTLNLARLSNKAPSLNPPLMQYCHVIVGKRNSNQGNVLFITTANLVIPIIYKVDFKITGAGHIIRISSKSSGGPLSALTCCVNARLLSAIKKISPLIYSQSWVGSWVYTKQAMMTFTLIF